MDNTGLEQTGSAKPNLPDKEDIFPGCDRRGPLFSPNRVKLGIFGLNISSAGGITAAKDRHEIDWKQNVQLVQAAEKAGFEAAVPVARWRGFEGATNPWGKSFETYTWAAGLAASTSRIAIFSTSHVLTVSPVMAAKQMSTIDHISGGRAVLNVVSGWFKKELDMFGVGDLDHDARYAYAEEWIEVLLRLWSQDETFDFEGHHIRVRGGYQQPKSIQHPRPPIMSAAMSPVGHAFAARWADIAFVSPDAANPSGVKEKVSHLRQLAANNGRELQIWSASSVLCAATEAAARAEIARYIEREGDQQAAANRSAWGLAGARVSAARQESMKKTGSIGGGYGLVGTPQQIADDIAALSEAGLDGLCLTWMNFERGLPQFIDEVLPLLEKSGVRRPVGIMVDAC
ncbi:MAG TPA: LLM class flavin-dependent oxidoreductase [Alphaproteobacteria bacterium]|nr:LLM class flavin-dependent oxidoreductase [Alphaproteobacteria bacterium]